MLGQKDIRKISAYWTLAVYWFLNGFDNLLQLLSSPGTGSSAIRQFSFYYSLTEAPLLLLVFALARQGRWRRGLALLTAAFVVGESILIRDSARGHLLLILGCGLTFVILSSLAGLWEYLKKMEHSRFENSMVFIYAALLFYYGSMLIIYIFGHIHRSTSASASASDSYLLYYTSLLLSAAVTCAGLWNYRTRKSPGASWSPHSGYSSSSS